MINSHDKIQVLYSFSFESVNSVAFCSRVLGLSTLLPASRVGAGDPGSAKVIIKTVCVCTWSTPCNKERSYRCPENT